MVNIAVFAAFRFYIGGYLTSNPEFKPRASMRQRDIIPLRIRSLSFVGSSA